jgi:putative membrane protein
MLVHLAALALTILGLSWFLPSVHIKGVGTAIAVAIVFSILNFFLGWFIRVMLFVPAVLTLGMLFVFVPFIVNAVVLWLTDKVMANFEIDTTAGLLISAAVITLVNGLFHASMFRAVAYGHALPHYDPGWI